LTASRRMLPRTGGRHGQRGEQLADDGSLSVLHREEVGEVGMLPAGMLDRTVRGGQVLRRHRLEQLAHQRQVTGVGDAARWTRRPHLPASRRAGWCGAEVGGRHVLQQVTDDRQGRSGRPRGASRWHLGGRTSLRASARPGTFMPGTDTVAAAIGPLFVDTDGRPSASSRRSCRGSPTPTRAGMEPPRRQRRRRAGSDSGADGIGSSTLAEGCCRRVDLAEAPPPRP